ncbi:MAL [Cervus elaphus hippelaphus]|uniref:MAL n=1 Tax=Cervus elaphus hippelaphus TaxID=46360 RepID=A0A212CXT5_CEREH|nr:MAL [Cervus elaphus hippelaphus]
MATGTASGGSRLPRGSAVFTTFPDLLFVFEFVSGGLVWILILLAQDTAYHCLAALFYFSASALETLVTIGLQDDIYKHYSENISAVVSPQFSLSVHSSRRPLMGALSRRVFSIIVSLLYVVHALFSLIRCKVSYRNREHS